MGQKGFANQHRQAATCSGPPQPPSWLDAIWEKWIRRMVPLVLVRSSRCLDGKRGRQATSKVTHCFSETVKWLRVIAWLGSRSQHCRLQHRRRLGGTRVLRSDRKSHFYSPEIAIWPKEIVSWASNLSSQLALACREPRNDVCKSASSFAVVEFKRCWVWSATAAMLMERKLWASDRKSHSQSFVGFVIGQG